MNYLRTLLATTLFFPSASSFSMPLLNINCPQAQNIKSEGLYKIREVNYGQYKGEQYSYYNTPHDWQLLIYPISADSENEAFQKGNALLNEIKGDANSEYVNGRIYCHYKSNHYGIGIIASTQF